MTDKEKKTLAMELGQGMVIGMAMAIPYLLQMKCYHGELEECESESNKHYVSKAKMLYDEDWHPVKREKKNEYEEVKAYNYFNCSTSYEDIFDAYNEYKESMVY